MPTVTSGPAYVSVNSAPDSAKICCDSVLDNIRLPMTTDAGPSYPDICTVELVHPNGPGNRAETDPSADSTAAVNCPVESTGTEDKLKKICDGDAAIPIVDAFSA